MTTMLPDATKADAMISQLGRKELEVVKLITAGKTCPEICTIMNIKEGTYRSHKLRIKKKMGGLPVWGWPSVLLSVIPKERLFDG